MVTFLFAFSYECFISSTLASIWTTAAGWIAIAILVVWTIITGWEGGETSVWERQRQMLLRAYEHAVPEHVRTSLAKMHDKHKEALQKLSAQAHSLQTRVHTYVHSQSMSLPHTNDPPMTDGSTRVSSV